MKKSRSGRSSWTGELAMPRCSVIRSPARGVASGGGIAMFAPVAIGFPQFQELASLGRVPMMAHMAMSGWLWQAHGMSVRAWAKFLRLFGADVVLYPALEGTLRARRSELETVKEVCRMNWHGLKASMPAAGGGNAYRAGCALALDATVAARYRKMVQARMRRTLRRNASEEKSNGTNAGIDIASERSERATRTERAGEAARESACGGVRGAKPLGQV